MLELPPVQDKTPNGRSPVKKTKVADFLEPVSANSIAQIFGVRLDTVKERLADCPSVTDGKTAIRRYRVRDAAPYIVKTAFTADQFVGIMKRGELPDGLRKDFWDAMLKQQKWEENAGDLWRTSTVRDVMRDTFQTIKFTMQLWVDTLERQTSLSEEQRTALSAMVDGLQQEVYTSLVKKAAEGNTLPTSSERPDE